MPWTASDIPDQTGKTYVITGANGGLGLEATRALAARGAKVVMACRNLDKAAEAVDGIRRDTPDADLDVRALDLASLASIRAFSDGLLADLPHVDVLMNNAGVMAIPRRTTEDGFEMQLGTNHLGHFALTGQVLPLVTKAPAGRIVNVSSQAHRTGRMRWDDLMGERSYERWSTYGQSKLANLLFTYELARRLEAAGEGVVVAAAHPGYSDTDLQYVGPRLDGSSIMATLSGWGNALFAQPATKGALPQLYAATMPEVASGSYYGPDGWFQMQGWPTKVDSNARSHDRDDQRRLWETSVTLTGVDFGGL
ncbi:MAG: SDR family oxidoreductase [Alphaproteobacteria bacterium]|nr:SDR family oxidoreductase [Alphaproteobacteria bacterium]